MRKESSDAGAEGAGSMALPGLDAVDRELERERQKHSRGHVARMVLLTVSVAFAAAVLLSMLAFPLYRIYGGSMEPTLREGDIVLAARSADYHTGDLAVFSYNNKTLVKRVIGCPGDWVDISDDGTVTVNGAALDEPYLEGGKSLGQCDITLPVQVPEGAYFVLGDQRSIAVDSRLSQMGCIPKEQMAGKVLCRIWPLGGLKAVGLS